MKNLSIILNIILFIAVAILYFLHLSGTKIPEVDESQMAADTTQMPDEVTVVYIKEDSLLENYQYFQDLADELETKRKNMENNYTSRAQGLQSEIENFQRTAGNMTINQARAIEEDLMRKQQNLARYQESLAQEMMQEEARVNRQLYQRVTEFLTEYARKNGYTLVLNYRPGSVLLYGHQGMDVTKEVIKGLNEDYQASSGKPAGSEPAVKDTLNNQ